MHANGLVSRINAYNEKNGIVHEQALKDGISEVHDPGQEITRDSALQN